MRTDMDQDAELNRTLNSLLSSLEIPLVLQTPLDLNPPLILQIFESMLKTHLPISSSTRKCESHRARVEAMKIFIGVLGDDVLGVKGGGGDVGMVLGEVDPRRLAEGEEEEVRCVAEVLGWVGKRMGYLSQDGRPRDFGNVARSRSKSSDWMADDDGCDPRPESPCSTVTGHGSSLLMDSTRGLDDSVTTVTTQVISDDNSQYTFHDGLSFWHEDRGRAGIEEEDDDLPSVMSMPNASRRYNLNLNSDSESEESTSDIDDLYCHCASHLGDSGLSNIIPPIRETGYLERIDVEDELRVYESRRNNTKYNDRRPSQYTPRARPSGAGGIITRHTSPLQHTLALLDERARLLSELANLRSAQRPYPSSTSGFISFAY